MYDKTGLAELARGLHEAGVAIVSTGSTAKTIADAGVPVTPVEEVTGFPEVLDGRVKTLHPHVHAGLLADQRKPEHVAALAELGVAAFELVVVNLYPFTQTVDSGAGEDECVEQIDIGGPSMVRAAAKNHPSVAVVVDPLGYDGVLAAVRAGGFTLEERKKLASLAFRHTAEYDVAVAAWMASVLAPEGDAAPPSLPLWTRCDVATRGRAALRREPAPAGRALPRRRRRGRGWRRPSSCTEKRCPTTTTPMPTRRGARRSTTKRPAWRSSSTPTRAGSRSPRCRWPTPIARPTSAIRCRAFGGVIAANTEVSVEMAETVADIFTEVIIAPAYEPGAVEVLARKKNIRVLVASEPQQGGTEFRQISGGLLMQQRDEFTAPGDDSANWTLATGSPADPATLADLMFAWRACRAVKSNAIVVAADGATVGVGMGQVNRVDAAKLAVQRAGDRVRARWPRPMRSSRSPTGSRC